MQTGIIRRMDDLGRIVIPRELRHQLGIKEGDIFGISVGDHGNIILQKQSTLADVSGEIDRIKNAVIDNEAAEDIREEVFKQLNIVEELIKTVRE